MFIIIKILIIILFIVIGNLFIRRKERYNGSFKQNFIILIVPTLLIVLLIIMPKVTMDYLNEGINNIYNKYLVDSIINKTVNIDLKPSEELLSLDNPYDVEQRKGVDYSFDTSFYNGKYYVYFGVLPALLIFVPFKLITGSYLSIFLGALPFYFLSIVLTVLVTVEIYKKWFNELPFSMLLIFTISNLISGLYVWNAWRIYIYELALMSGYCFVQLGIYLMLLTIKNNTGKNNILLFFSCLCMALSVACRPTLVVSSVLLLPFFTNYYLT